MLFSTRCGCSTHELTTAVVTCRRSSQATFQYRQVGVHEAPTLAEDLVAGSLWLLRERKSLSFGVAQALVNGLTTTSMQAVLTRLSESRGKSGILAGSRENRTAEVGADMIKIQCIHIYLNLSKNKQNTACIL